MSVRVGENAFGGKRFMEPALEQVLIEQSKRRDSQAFSRLIDAYQARLYGFVKRMVRNEEDALDVTQDVFIKAYQAIDKFDGRSSLRTWLFRIAYNQCVDRSRKAERVPKSDSMESNTDGDESLEVYDNRFNPETLLMNEELYAVVETAIGNISEKLRTVLLLHDREDMGYEEIAATIDVPVGTVKSRLFLARESLQRQVGQYLEANS